MPLPRLRRLTLWVGTLLLLGFLLIQLKQPERTNPPVVSEIHAPPEVAAILERSCYPCHSHETEWPWYSHVMPISWFVIDHVDEGRRDLNFSDWPLLDFEEIELALTDIDEQIANDEMPLPSYLLLHPSARLSDEDKETLREWAQRGG